MKRISHLLTFLLLLALPAAAQKVFVVPVETEIDLAAFHHFKKAIAEARDTDANLIIVKLNTYGGAVDAADSIRTSLMRSAIPTVAFVDVNAASAGALIALACDSVYMAPGASMGSATVVNGAGEPMPAKYQSYMSTIMRATAEHHGKFVEGDSSIWRRNPEIAASMVNPDVSVSLTAAQAVECGYADGIASNIDEVLADLDMPQAEIQYYHSTFTDDFLGFLSSAGVRAILVMLILGGIYMEMHTAGMGFAACVSVVATVLYFLPMLITGAVPSWILILFIIGIILIVLEIFVVPGFGITGISGIVAICVALVGAMTSSDAVTGFDFTSLTTSLAIFGAGGLMAFALVMYLTSSHGPKFIRRHSELMTELKVSEGFVGVDMSPAKYIGYEAKTFTDMRPAGKIEIDGRIFDAVSIGPFIPAHHKVKVTKYENAQLFVRIEN